MTKFEKILKIRQLLLEINNYLVDKFFDPDSDKLLDKKIEVLTKLSKGEQPDNDSFYEILELYPAQGEIWD